MKTLIPATYLFSIIIVLLSLNAVAQDERPLLEEIIVTAEKRSESLQDLSQAVTALSGEDIDNRNITSFVDLSSIAPGVTVAKNEGFKTVISIRGVGNETNQNASANPSVSYHLDGIYVASPYALHTDFLDIERIEVLRGPQGTLFGQNSTGGAINVITQAPDTEEFFGNADLTVGNYGLIRTRGSVNVPMSDTLALRASVSYHYPRRIQQEYRTGPGIGPGRQYFRPGPPVLEPRGKPALQPHRPVL